MARLLRHPLETTHSLGAGVLARLRGWLEAYRLGRVMVSDHGSGSRDETRVPGARAQVLPFPIRGEAVLVQMAGRLRQRIGHREWVRNPLLLTMSRLPHSRLSIDHNTYVEFDPGATMFRVVIEAEPGTRFTIDTADFNKVVDFIGPYVNERLSEAMPLESAS